MKLYDYLKERAETYLSLIKDMLRSSKISEDYTISLWSRDLGEDNFYGCVGLDVVNTNDLHEITTLIMQIGEIFYKYFNTEVYCKQASGITYYVYQTGIKPFRKDTIYLYRDSKRIYILSALPTEVNIDPYILHSTYLHYPVEDFIEDVSLKSIQSRSLFLDKTRLIYKISPDNRLEYGFIVHVQLRLPREYKNITEHTNRLHILEEYVHPSVETSKLSELYQGSCRLSSIPKQDSMTNKEEIYNFRLLFSNCGKMKVPDFRGIQHKQSFIDRYFISLEDKYKMLLSDLPEDLFRSEAIDIFGADLEYLKQTVLENLWYVTRNPVLKRYLFNNIFSDMWAKEDLEKIDVSHGKTTHCKCCSKLTSFYHKNIPLCSMYCIDRYTEFEARKNLKKVRIPKTSDSFIKGF